MIKKAPERTVERLSQYRRLLLNLLADKKLYVYSHELANFAAVTAAQVRRDLMAVGYTGSPARGYDVQELAGSIRQFLDSPAPQAVALIGVGNLGRAILAYFAGRRPNLKIVAAFDVDIAKTGRVIHGCRCYGMNELGEVVDKEKIDTAIVAVPVGEAQGVVDQLVAAGVQGVLNFAPARVRAPDSVYVQDVDMTALLEKVAFFARR